MGYQAPVSSPTAVGAPRRPSAASSVRSALSAILLWVPIRRLARRHRQRILSHLLELHPPDRYLRFGHQATDEQIRRYVMSLDFERDQVFGIFNRRLKLISVAHLAYEVPQQVAGSATMAEFGVSVAKSARGRGLGARLFERAVMHARNRRIDTLYINALTENTAMLKIARKAGATVVREGSESQAHLKLPAHTLATHVEQLIEGHAAEVDYRLKLQALRFDHLLEAIAEVKAGVGKHGAAQQ